MASRQNRRQTVIHIVLTGQLPVDDAADRLAIAHFKGAAIVTQALGAKTLAFTKAADLTQQPIASTSSRLASAAGAITWPEPGIMRSR